MGAGAAISRDNLPDMVDEEIAQRYLGKCFDRSDWDAITAGQGIVDRATFLAAVSMRDHPPSLRAWLEFWRLEEFGDRLQDEFEVLSPSDLLELDAEAVTSMQLNTVQTRRWEKAISHAQYLRDMQCEHPPAPLNLWLESWRLQRLEEGLYTLGCDSTEDVIDLDENDVAPLGLRLLEQRRWTQAREHLSRARDFDFALSSNATVPSLQTWLQSLRLDPLHPKLELLGAVELADLADIDDRELAALGMNKLQLKHWEMGMRQVIAAQREAMGDGRVPLPNFQAWLESWRLGRLSSKLRDLGAYVQQDLLDLEPSEYHLLEMKPLEAKRFEQAISALMDDIADSKAFDSEQPTRELEE